MVLGSGGKSAKTRLLLTRHSSLCHRSRAPDLLWRGDRMSGSAGERSVQPVIVVFSGLAFVIIFGAQSVA